MEKLIRPHLKDDINKLKTIVKNILKKNNYKIFKLKFSKSMKIS
jgi:hypothetical protein